MAFKDDEARRAYFREYNKGWYQRHKERLFDKRKQHHKELREWLRSYKSKLCCKQCGERRLACLHFHHRDKAEKSFSVANMALKATSKKRLLDEIAKCDVLCVNCHAKFHWREKYGTDDWEDVLFSEA